MVVLKVELVVVVVVVVGMTVVEVEVEVVVVVAMEDEKEEEKDVVVGVVFAVVVEVVNVELDVEVEVVSFFKMNDASLKSNPKPAFKMNDGANHVLLAFINGREDLVMVPLDTQCFWVRVRRITQLFFTPAMGETIGNFLGLDCGKIIHVRCYVTKACNCLELSRLCNGQDDGGDYDGNGCGHRGYSSALYTKIKKD
ncbi:unnamed protein product [Prunus armeniaca]